MLTKFYSEYLELDARLHIHGRADPERARADLRSAEQRICAYLSRQGGTVREGDMVFKLEACTIGGQYHHYFLACSQISSGEYQIEIERRARAVAPIVERRQRERRKT